jgi:hypothetical protein
MKQNIFSVACAVFAALGPRVRGPGPANRHGRLCCPQAASGEQNPIRVTLGRVGEITLADARENDRAAIAAVWRGVHVNAAKGNEC